LSNRYQQEIRLIEKLDTGKIFTAIYFDGGSGYFYLKRFRFEVSENLLQSFISEAEGSYLVDISEDTFPRIQVTFSGKHAKRPSEIIDAVEFINDKSFRAKGKRITTFEVEKIEFIEPGADPGKDDNNGKDDEMDFELDGPVSQGKTPPAPVAGEKPSANLSDEDAYQMTLL
jgi:topoisomerase-4 subunit A